MSGAIVSLTHLIDLEAKRRGLSTDELLTCLTKALITFYHRKGEIVNVHVHRKDHGHIDVQLTKMVLRDDMTVEEVPVRYISTPEASLLAETIDTFRSETLGLNPWVMVKTRMLSVEADHYLLEIVEGDFQGKVAVLPMAYNSITALNRREAIFCVVQPWRPENVAGAENWRRVEVPLVASRNHKDFLKTLISQQLNMRVDVAVMGGAAMIVMPPGTTMSPLVTRQGEMLHLLQRITGHARIFVAPTRINPKERERLRNAVRSVSGLKHPVDYRMVEPKSELHPFWMVYVHHACAARFIGSQGHNLFFIMYLAGMQFRYRVVQSIGGSAITLGDTSVKGEGIEEGEGVDGNDATEQGDAPNQVANHARGETPGEGTAPTSDNASHDATRSN